MQVPIKMDTALGAGYIQPIIVIIFDSRNMCAAE